MKMSAFCQLLATYSIVSSRCPTEPEHEESGNHAAHWSYADQKEWDAEFPLCKGKVRQSPINIITKDVIQRRDYVLEFIDYNQDLHIDAKNNGHSVSVSPHPDNEETKPRVKLSWMYDEFELQEVHFHWGQSANRPGSEHRIDGEQAGAEMHMVHFKKGITKDQIGYVHNSVTVVGVFIKPDEGAEPNKELEYMVDTSTQVNGTDSEVQVPAPKTVNIDNLLPENMSKFYAYEGSLTTPPCYETVNWIVLSDPIYMSPEKLEELENISTSDASGIHKISQNFREVQPLVGRKVFSSTNIEDSISKNLQVQQSQTANNRFEQVVNV